ncbi:putative bifunctional diguanylate cyclase/phosphodiesterase [Nocardioides sp. DS6]|uniref:Bifunctional diguanylate cyclase/phosphodiesterase n=2 Tax=Nocardioides eburneus TaxID=3231482 RepID=A0ABV3SVF9_9ACTN
MNSFAHPASFVVLLLLLTYTHVRPTRLVHRHGSVESDHLDEALFVPMVLLIGPFEVATAVAVASFAGNLAARRAPVKVVFNVGQTVLSCLAGYAVARAGGAQVESPISSAALLACCAGGLVFAIASSFAVAGIVRLAAGHPLLTGLWEQWRTRGIASLGALLLGVVAGIAVHDHPLAALPAIALGWTVERAYVAIVVQRQARLSAEAVQEAVVAVRNSDDPEEVRDQLLASAATVLQAKTARLVTGTTAVAPAALRAPIDDETALEVADRVGGGAWLDGERDALSTLATVGGAALRNSRLLAHLTAITNGQSEGVLAIDAAGVVTFANPAARRLLSHPGELLGAVADDVFALDGAAGRVDLTTLAGSHGGIGDDDAVLRTGSALIPVAFTAAGLPAPQTGVVVVLHDITERKSFEEKLSYIAFHDPLTDLPNRRLFEDRLDHALARAQRNSTSHALLVVDLDRFKLVNDSYGRPAGDRLLVQVAARLRRTLREEDTCARLGGDEFAILIEDVGGSDQALAWAERVLDALDTGYEVDGHQVFISASVGVAMSDQVPSREALIAAADVAAAGAKSTGKARYRLFRPGTAEVPRARLELEAALRRALERGEFDLHYQPLVDTVTGETVGAEALLRWHSPSGVVAPFTFIPLAEETGLIGPLGAWALEEACRQGQEWSTAHPERRPLKISVNLSAHQLSRPDIVSEVEAILKRTGFPPDQLCLEITETVIMTDAEAAILTLRELKALGLQIAIDDFGTGYSSLSYLKRFPVDVVKIDRTFTSGLGDNPVDSEIVAAVIRLAAATGFTVVAEGVETERQRRALAMLGCPLIQGFLIATPLKATDFASFWATDTDRRAQRR